MTSGTETLPWRIVLIASLAAGIALFQFYRPEFLNPDTGQLISVARNLVEGEGVSTSVLYYEEQYATQTLPTPQTIWPPGYALFIALLALLGIPELTGAFWIAIVAHVSIAPLLFVLGRRLELAAPACAALGIAWLLLLAPATLPMTAFTEPAFTACTLLSLLALLVGYQDDSRPDYRWILVSGALAATSFLIRYLGVTFIAAVGIFLAARWIRAPSRQRFTEGLAFALVPVVVCGAVFARNLLLTGELTGGPAVESPVGLAETVKAFYRAALKSLGVFGSGPIRSLNEFIVLVIGFLAALIALPLMFRVRVEGRGQGTSLVLWIACLYCCATALLLVLLAMDRSSDLVQWRYFVPLLPFALLFLGIASRIGWRRVRSRSMGRVVFASSVLLAVPLSLAQWEVIRAWDTEFVNVRVGRSIAAAMREPFGEGVVGDVFARPERFNDVILTPDGQVLGGLIRQPVLGLASPYYTSRTWSREEVEDLVGQYHVNWIMFFRGLFHPEGPNDRNKTFFIDLAKSDLPPWLTIEHRSAKVELYSVDWAAFNEMQDRAE